MYTKQECSSHLLPIHKNALSWVSFRRIGRLQLYPEYFCIHVLICSVLGITAFVFARTHICAGRPMVLTGLFMGLLSHFRRACSIRVTYINNVRFLPHCSYAILFRLCASLNDGKRRKNMGLSSTSNRLLSPHNFINTVITIKLWLPPSISITSRRNEGRKV